MAKILLVDDDPNVCKVVGDYLQRQGFKVIIATDGREGLEVAGREFPDLILCDFDMPGMDGHAVIRRLRSDDRLAEIPVIFISGWSDHAQIRETMNLGADDFLSKPVSLQEVHDAINARLARHQKMLQWRGQRFKKPAEVRAGISHDPSKVRGLGHGLDSQKQSGELKEPGFETSKLSLNSPAVLVKDHNRQQLLDIFEIKALIADGEYSVVHWDKDQHVMFRKSLKQWQSELPQDQFMRVHRGAIVNLRFFEFLDKDADGHLQIHLKEFKEAIPVSQRATPSLNRCLKDFNLANRPGK
jgi:DNA-binding response OmpR family regulator